MSLFTFHSKIFILGHLVTALIFTILYYLADLHLFYFPEFSKRIGFGSLNMTEGSPQSFFYYIYYSLITQSTVGYAGGKAGMSSFEDVSSNLFKAINILQIISIFVITGCTLSTSSSKKVLKLL